MKVISTTKAPAVIGPYSQAIRSIASLPKSSSERLNIALSIAIIILYT